MKCEFFLATVYEIDKLRKETTMWSDSKSCFDIFIFSNHDIHIYKFAYLPVIWFCNASKSFVSCSIPQLQFDRRTIGHFKHPCKKIHTNCRVWYFKKWTVCKTSQQGTFTHSRVSNQNDSKDRILCFKFSLNLSDFSSLERNWHNKNK